MNTGKAGLILIGVLVITALVLHFTSGETHSQKRSPNLDTPEIQILIESYGHPSSTETAVLSPPALQQRHLDARYRKAWESLLLSLADNPDPTILFMRDRIEEAFWKSASAESIPTLKYAFQLWTDSDGHQELVIYRQESILRALAATAHPDSLAAIFECLDLLDKRYPDELKARTSGGLDLREWTFQAMMQPDNPGRSDKQKKEQRLAQQWRTIAKTYPSQRTSKANEAFLQRLRTPIATQQ
jgi:hypothetical protein